MPSKRFVAELKPDPLLRQVVMLAACAALVAGFALLIHLPLAPWARLGLAMVWLVSQSREISRLARGAGRVRQIRIGKAVSYCRDLPGCGSDCRTG
jgi:hypothetical protein